MAIDWNELKENENMKDLVKEVTRIKDELTQEKQIEKAIESLDYLSTGVTLLNLAFSGEANGGMAKGHIYRLAGKSGTSKTFLSRSILAEAVANPEFNDYKLCYDDVEHGALMSTEKFFGERLAKRMKVFNSVSTNDFYTTLGKKLEDGEKVIWIEDSLDGLVPVQESKMGDMSKARETSQGLRKLLDPINDTGSIVVLISQTRMNIGSFMGGDSPTGGRAPEFYSTQEVFLKKIKTIKKAYKDNDYPIGVRIQAHVTKNRISGVDRTIEFPLYYTYGIDDIGANIDYLCSHSYWKLVKGIITLDDFGGFKGRKDELIAKVEKENLEEQIKTIVNRIWKEIEEAVSIDRQPRYS